MAKKSPTKQVFIVPLEYPSGAVRNVRVKAATREVAERRALKFNPTAIGVKGA